MKAWLARNKIIFETLVAASLTVMGVLVSIAAVIISIHANELLGQQNELSAQQYELAEKQFEWERYRGEPVFAVKWEEEEPGCPYYVVKNIGAEIYDVGYNVSTSFYGGSVSFLSEGNLLYQVRIVEGTDNDTAFEQKHQSFHISAHRFLKDGKPYDIESDFMKVFGQTPMSRYVYITIKYRNYRDEQCKSYLRISCRRDSGRGRDSYGEAFFTAIGENDNIIDDPFNDEDSLVFRLSQRSDPEERFREVLSQYYANE